MTRKIMILLGMLTFIGRMMDAQMLTLPNKRPSPQITWDSQAMTILDTMGTSIKIGDYKDRTFKSIPSPSSIFSFNYSGGSLHSVGMVDNIFEYRQRALAGAWETHPIVKAEGDCGIPFFLYATERKDQFLGVNVDTGFVVAGEASNCAWFGLGEDGKLRLQSVIPLELDGPVHTGLQAGGGYRMALVRPRYAWLVPFLDHPIRVPGAFVVVSMQAGMLWVIEDGSPFAKRIDLAGSDGLSVGKGSGLPPVLLGVQPLRNGHLLIARLNPARYSDSRPADPGAPGALEAPSGPSRPGPLELLWIDLDPVSGDHHPAGLDVLGNAPTSLASWQEAWSFSFGLDLGGRVVAPWRSPEAMPWHGPTARKHPREAFKEGPKEARTVVLTP